jgi:hypothetical protein
MVANWSCSCGFYRPGVGYAYLASSNGNGTYSIVVGYRNGMASYDLKGNSDFMLALDYNKDGRSNVAFCRPYEGKFFMARNNIN